MLRRFCFCVWILVQVAFGQIANLSQEDQLGLFPPSSADRSTLVAGIREALASRQLSLARDRSQNLIGSEPASHEGFFWRGFVELQLRNTPQAILYLRQAQEREASPAVLKTLAVCYYMQRQYRLFVDTMNEALQKQPDDFAPYYYLGRHYDSEVNDFIKAADFFMKALERKPDHFRSQYHLGYCMEATRKLDEAARLYQGAIDGADKLGERFALPYQGLARLRLLSSQPQEALPLARKAVELDPGQADNHRLLAKALTELNRNEEAAQALEKAAELDPTDAAIHYQIYRLYSKTNEKQKAKAALERYKTLSAIYGRS